MKLGTHLTARLPFALDALHSLVALNSFTTNASGVEDVARATARLFAPLGFTPEYVPAHDPRHGPHLFLRRPGATGPTIAFVTHSDTVYPADEERAHNFIYRDDGLRVYGPGVADIKGGTVVAWMALDALAACHPEVFTAVDWVVASNAAEEELNPDFAERLIERTPGAAAILVMECGADRAPSSRPGPTLVVARKGRWSATIRCPGRAAHAGTGFWNGDNAILRASRLTLALAALSDRQRDVSVNVGVVQGGTVVNRVPHEALLQVEMRAFDAEAFAATRSRILALVIGEGATCEQVSELPAWPRQPDAPLAWFVDHGPEHRAGLSDANLLFHHAPTLDGLGPVGGHCHCSQPGHQEYAVRSSFVTRARVLAEGLVRGLHQRGDTVSPPAREANAGSISAAE